MTLNSNAFVQEPIRGTLDLQINRNGVISGMVAAGQATALKPGDKVKLDSTNTGAVPKFLKAAETEIGIGCVVYGVKGTFSAGDPVEVAFSGGPVMYMSANGAIEPGAEVESEDSDTPSSVKTKASNARIGIALDPASGAGVLLRVIISPAAA